MVVLLTDVVDQAKTLVAVQLAGLDLFEHVKLVSGFHVLKKRISVVFAVVTQKADDACFVSIKVILFPLTPFVATNKSWKLVKCTE